MTLVSLEKIQRRFGDLVVLDGVGFSVEEKDRLGVIGDNGVGKTTLIRILAGIDEPDRGARNTRKNLRVAYGSQVPDLPAGKTVLEFILQGDGAFNELEARIRQLEARLAESPNDPKTLQEYGDLQGAFEAGGGYDRRHLCERVLAGLGFGEAECEKDVAVLSGGEASRLVLACLMVQPADLLVLDEPTNHLDLAGIEFVEGFVQQYPGAIVAVSHDRMFLDAVVTGILEVDSGWVTRFKGNYSAYAKQRDLNILSTSRAHKDQQEFIKKEMDFIRKHMGSRLTAQAKGRLKRLKRLEIIQRPRTARREMGLSFAGGRGLEGQAIVEAEEVGAVLPQGVELFGGVSFRLYHGETLGLLGSNGAGKTTLLRMLAGLAMPTHGHIHRARGVQAGYFSQETTGLPGQGTVLGALAALAPQATAKELRDHLALFLFSGQEVEKQVEELSGGEKRRLCLARLTWGEYDFLCLDEPTNHLDITAREGLEEALRAFKGAAIVVSHDRQFLEAVAGRVVYLAAGRLRVFDRGLEHCLEALREERLQKKALARSRRADQRSAAAPPTAQAQAQASAGKIRNPLMFKKLEEEIIALEEELETLHTDMEKPTNYSNHENMQALLAREKELDENLRAAFERWENWS